MILLAAPALVPRPAASALAADDPFPAIKGGSACDQDEPTPGSCNCSGTPMGPEAWRLTQPDWFTSNLTSAFDAHAPLSGNRTSLRRFAGRNATLVINIASAWGYQNLNYNGLRDLLLAYNESGFQVLAFPCNQFGGQAPASDACERNYTYRRMQLPFSPPSFTIFDKVDVNGPHALPLFRFLKTKAPRDAPFDVCGHCDIAWNYEKFVVNSSGWPVRRIPAGVSPTEAEPAIRKLLGLTELKAPAEIGIPKRYPKDAEEEES